MILRLQIYELILGYASIAAKKSGKTDLNATQNVKNIKKVRFTCLFVPTFSIFSVPLRSIGLKAFKKYILKYER